MPHPKIECPICVSDEKEDNETWVALVPCAHIFHEHCLLPWISSKVRITRNGAAYTCPTCRAVVPKSIDQLGHVPAVAVRYGYLPLKIDMDGGTAEQQQISDLEVRLVKEREENLYLVKIREIEDATREELAELTTMEYKRKADLLNERCERIQSQNTELSSQLKASQNEVEKLKRQLSIYTSAFKHRKTPSDSPEIPQPTTPLNCVLPVDESTKFKGIMATPSSPVEGVVRRTYRAPSPQNTPIHIPSDLSKKQKGKQRAFTPEPEDQPIEMQNTEDVSIQCLSDEVEEL